MRLVVLQRSDVEKVRHCCGLHCFVLSDKVRFEMFLGEKIKL